MNPLVFAATRAPWILIAGLILGVALPSLAQTLQPFIPQMVLALLFLASFRMQPRDFRDSAAALPGMIGAVLALQLALPLVVLGLALAGGWGDTDLAFALVLMTAAPPIAGSPNMLLMLGLSPVHAIRLLIAGTALLPLTVVPVFFLVPDGGPLGPIFVTSAKLLLAIVLTSISAIAMRKYLAPNPSLVTLQNLDGLSAITLAVFVIALMPNVTEVFAATPLVGLRWLLAGMLANFGLQLATFFLLRGKVPAPLVATVSLASGNRNIALFLVALPAESTAPVMIFVGCYQIPMYLTPLILRHLYRL